MAYVCYQLGFELFVTRAFFDGAGKHVVYAVQVVCVLSEYGKHIVGVDSVTEIALRQLFGALPYFVCGYHREAYCDYCDDGNDEPQYGEHAAFAVQGEQCDAEVQ